MLFYDILAGIILTGIFAMGLYMRYWVGKRRFERRGVGGLHQFPSYSKGLITNAYEGLVLWLSIPVILIEMFGVFFWIVLFRGIIKDDLKRKAYKEKESAVEAMPTSSSLGTGLYQLEENSQIPGLPSIFPGKTENQAV